MSWPAVFLRGPEAAAGFACINSLGAVGGFLGPYMVGLLAGGSGGYGAAMAVLAVALLLSGGLILGKRASDLEGCRNLVLPYLLYVVFFLVYVADIQVGYLSQSISWAALCRVHRNETSKRAAHPGPETFCCVHCCVRAVFPVQGHTGPPPGTPECDDDDGHRHGGSGRGGSIFKVTDLSDLSDLSDIDLEGSPGDERGMLARGGRHEEAYGGARGPAEQQQQQHSQRHGQQQRYIELERQPILRGQQ